MSSDLFEPEPAQDDEQLVGLLGSEMEARAEHQKTRHYQSFFSCATSLGVGLIIVVLFWILNYRNGFSWQSTPKIQFNWHPFLMVLSMVFLYSQSMLIYRTFRNAQKKVLKVLHAVLHFLAFILCVIGLQAVFDSHNLAEPPMANLYTLHSWIGLSTVIIFATQFLVGFVTFLFPGLSKNLRQIILPMHTKFGIACFVLALIATCTGIMEKAIWTVGDKYKDLTSEGMIMNFMGIFTVIYGLIVLYLINETDYKRMPLADDHVMLTESN